MRKQSNRPTPGKGQGQPAVAEHTIFPVGQDEAPAGTSMEQVDDIGHVVGNVRMLPLSCIEPDPDQPRKHFDQRELQDLANNIRELRARRQGIEGSGYLSAITVRRKPITHHRTMRYIIVAGERRYQAGKLLRLGAIPAIIEDMAQDDAMEQALYENIQRSDLSPLEEGLAMVALMNRHGLSYRNLADRLGKHLSWVNNRVALTTYGTDVQNMVVERPDAMIAARQINKVKEPGKRRWLISQVKQGVPFRQIDDEVKLHLEQAKASKTPVSTSNGSHHVQPAQDSEEPPQTVFGSPRDPDIKTLPASNINLALDSSIMQINKGVQDMRGTTIVKAHFRQETRPRIRQLRMLLDELEELGGHKE